MAEYKSNYRVVTKVCPGCNESKKMPTRNTFCSKTCSVKMQNKAVVVKCIEEKPSPRILLLDIETFPNLAFIWDLYEATALSVERSSIVGCFSAKWLDGEQITKSLPDYPNYKKDAFDDSALVNDLWLLLDSADICIAHNGDNFDFKKVNARFVFYNLSPPSPYKTIDTLKVARDYFKFGSNRLNDLGEYLGLGKKVDTGGFKLWQDCMLGKDEAWKLMKVYNKQDVVLLEKVYLRFRPWVKNHPNIGVYADTAPRCPKCGSGHVQLRGTTVTNTARYHRAECQSCGGWSRFKNNVLPKGNTYLTNVL